MDQTAWQKMRHSHCTHDRYEKTRTFLKCSLSSYNILELSKSTLNLDALSASFHLPILFCTLVAYFVVKTCLKCFFSHIISFDLFELAERLNVATVLEWFSYAVTAWPDVEFNISLLKNDELFKNRMIIRAHAVERKYFVYQILSYFFRFLIDTRWRIYIT